jgi:type IX secretion system PorP/SprF family membrane protein
MRVVFLVFLCSACLLSTVNGQDPQFSQYYSAPLILNPAMTGSTDCYRTGMNVRSQWTGLPGGAFNTLSFFMDLNHSDIRSGFGVLVLRDEQGTPRLTTNEVSGLYSYLVPFSSQVNLRFGLQGTFVSRNIGYSKLVFEDQYSGLDITDPQTADAVTSGTRVQYADFSSGVLLFGEKKYWLGFASHHMNRPKQAFLLGDSRLPVKFSIHGGYNFYFNKNPRNHEAEELRITPTFLYKWQGRFDQLDMGMYLLKIPVTFGIWYRGIFFKEDDKIRNNDAFIFQAGFQYKGFSFTYSYDYTTSKLYLRNTHGSHEISIISLFCLDWPKRRKPPRNVRILPCPDFKRSTR